MTLSDSNTLVLTGFDKSDFIADDINKSQSFVEQLRSEIATHVNIVHWAPLKSFCRAIVVLESNESASFIKQLINEKKLSNATFSKVSSYFTQSSSDPSQNIQTHLQPPKAGRLFLISPPVSPPSGWISRLEDPPHVHDASNFAMALTEALSRVPPSQEPSNTVTRQVLLPESENDEQDLIPSIIVDLI